ncbi:hypothetical protein ACFQ3S_06955 [Mucilaginibacter terrae]|uniref:hypothetical protein n=1 Tax=Mucilaginibacter terrae TaxID=1955052 RepID=UPI003634A5F0
MAEKLQLPFSETEFTALLNENRSNEDFVNNLFRNKGNHKLMCSALQEYHRNDGGSPEVHDFEIIRINFTPAILAGRFTCKFRVKYHFTCSDVRNEAGDTIVWDFKMDEGKHVIDITGEEPLVREGE